ncbi:MAG TPA: ABC transporter permease [Solirubrobacterales bacterium]|nr:ABC transporter permease [Solirubrobacterales bacterium]
MKRWVLPTLLLVGLVGAWQVAASTGVLADLLGLKPFLVPSPAEIAESLWQNRTLLAENAWVTLKEMVLGFGCAVVAGLGFAVAMHLFVTVRHTLYPPMVVSQAIPIIAIAPILVIWFGYGIGPKLWIVALVCFFPISVNTLDGLRSVDPEATKMMRTLDASRPQILWRLEAPTALPGFFSGAKVAAAVTGIAALFGEWAGANSGLGLLMREDNALLETSRLFAEVFLLAAMALALFALVALVERYVVTWR